MIYGLYNSAAGMMTNEYRQAVLSNNIANAETVGFKRDIATFAERLPAWESGEREGPSARSLEGMSGGQWLGKTVTDFSEGNDTPTGNWSDLALEGPGFFVVQGEGKPLYTRDGRMQMNVAGLLVASSDGAPILNAAGMPIQLNPHGGLPSVDTQGRVEQDGAQVAEVGIADFQDYGALQKVGAQRWAAPQGTTPAPSPALVRSGYTEGSSVQPVTEMVSMIEASRAYQINARMVSLQDETTGRLVSTILQA